MMDQNPLMVPYTLVHPFSRVVSWVIGIATILLGTCTLVIKWIILKPIHDEIIDKFHKKQPLFFKRNSICRIIDLQDEFNITFPVACLLILIFAIITKRIIFQRSKCCKGYFAVPMPVDLFAHVKRTFAAVVFAIFADDLLDIAHQVMTENSRPNDKGLLL